MSQLRQPISMRHVDDFNPGCIHRFEECGKSVVFVGIQIGHCNDISKFAGVGVERSESSHRLIGSCRHFYRQGM